MVLLVGLLGLIVSGRIEAAPRFVVDDEAFTKNATQAAERLLKEGKLVSLKSLLAQPPSKLPVTMLPSVESPPIASTELYERIKAGTVAIGLLYQCDDCDKWHVNLAAGFAVAEGGIVSTCAHVFEYDEEEAVDSYAIAVDSEEHVFPVKELLASDPDSDTCLVRIASDSLRPLPMRAGAKAGEKVFCLSHPNGHYFMFTQGIVARVSKSSLTQDEDDTEPHAKPRPTLSLEVTSEYSPGSSGGPIVDESGNVVAQVNAIETDEDPDDGTGGVVTARTATAAEEILRLADPANRPVAIVASEPAPVTNPKEAFAALQKVIDKYEANENEAAEDRLIKRLTAAASRARPLMTVPADRRKFSLLVSEQLSAYPENEEFKKALQMLKEFETDETASPEEKVQASNWIVYYAAEAVASASDFANWEKQYMEHTSKFPKDPELAGLKISMLDLAEEYAFERLTEIAKTLTTDDDDDVKDAAKSAIAAVKIKQELAAGPLELKFTALDGTEVDISKLRGKVVLIDFWATWCGPCMASLPEVIKTYKKLHEQGFEVVGVSLDEDKDELLSTLKKRGIPWPQYFDGKGWECQVATRFGISSIPAMWLINKKGMVVSCDADASDLAETVEKLLKE